MLTVGVYVTYWVCDWCTIWDGVCGVVGVRIVDVGVVYGGEVFAWGWDRRVHAVGNGVNTCIVWVSADGYAVWRCE